MAAIGPTSAPDLSMSGGHALFADASPDLSPIVDELAGDYCGEAVLVEA